MEGGDHKHSEGKGDHKQNEGKEGIINIVRRRGDNIHSEGKGGS